MSAPAVILETRGVYDVPEEVYHADPCPEPSLSASIAKLLLTTTPAHARLAHPRLNPAHVEDDAAKFDAGRAIHSAFLTGVDVLSVVAADSWRTNAAKAARDQIRSNGRIPVLTDQYDRLMATLRLMQGKIEQLEDRPLPFTDGCAEQTLVWQEDGIWCRARLDWLRDDREYVDDLKTVASANPGDGFGQFGRAVETLGHYVQDAFYRRGCRALFGIDPTFRFVAVELDGPGITCCSLSEAYRAVGDAAVSRAINLWRDCLQRNDWPGFPPYRVEISPPVRLISREEEEACL